MFTVSVTITTGTKSQVVPGVRRALWQLREFRDYYGVEPVVSDGERTYTEAELQRMLDAPSG